MILGKNMFRRLFSIGLALGLLFISLQTLSAGGMEESGSGSVEYMAAQGQISHPDDIITSSFISSVDYNYPDPEGAFGVKLYLGNRRISADGGEQIAVIGLQGARLPMDTLPPMNLCFVIDHSGSMSGEDKMSWVKRAFEVFIETVRDEDFVSVVKFDDTAEVVFPSTRMTGEGIRGELRQSVESVEPEGGTNLAAGIELGYQQVMTNFREGYINRVLFLTDGVGNSEGMVEMAAEFRQLGINVSTIGLGSGFNGELLREVARSGGGSSRFISDEEALKEMFGTGLSRMVVPVARDLKLQLTSGEGVVIRETWAYEYTRNDGGVSYNYPALHLGDYETIVVQLGLPEYPPGAEPELLRVSGSYIDGEGEVRRIPEQILNSEVVYDNETVDGFSNAIVLRAGTVVHFAEALKEIGRIYYPEQENTEAGETLAEEGSGETIIDKSRLSQAYELANRLKKELLSVQERLDFEGFSEEIEVTEAYIRILGAELDYSETAIEETVAEREPETASEEIDFSSKVNGLFLELTAEMTKESNQPLVISGFSFKEERQAPILEYLSNTAEVFLVNRIPQPIVSRADLKAVLEEQQLSLSGLFETETAIEVGKILSAHYMITGTVIEMNSSVIIFSRVINVESGEILGASQIIVEKDREVNELL